MSELDRTVVQLETFLRESGWKSSRETSSLRFFDPPDDLGIRGKYRIALPADSNRSGSDNLVLQAIDSLRSVYGLHFDDLYESLTKASTGSVTTVLSARFVDSCTAAGSIPLYAIRAFFEGIERGLHHQVKLKLGADAHSARLRAQAFTRDCKFLQTETGSFVARIEIPAGVLRQADMFGGDVVESSHVCSSLFSVIQFINSEVLQGEGAFESESLLQQAITLFTPELLESISDALLKAEIECIDFAMKIGKQDRRSTTGVITEKRANRLAAYVEFIKRHFYGENGFEIIGSIVELRSRDPQGSKNFIRVLADFHGDRTFVSATLNNDQYQRALEAHKSKRAVRIRANGIRLKTHIRVTELLEFVA